MNAYPNEVITLLMKMRGLSQDGLAQILGISQTQVSKRITGLASWRLDDLETLADNCHIPMTLFFESVPTVLRWIATFIEAHECEPWAVVATADELRTTPPSAGDGAAVA
jgi:transcriptional regulator with XRE-family HTH domain